MPVHRCAVSDRQLSAADPISRMPGLPDRCELRRVRWCHGIHSDQHRPPHHGRFALHQGTRVPVAMIVRMIANGTSVATLLEEYPQLTEGDIRESLQFAAASIDQRAVPLEQPA